MNKYFLLSLFIFLSACSGANGLNLSKYPDPNASKDEFIVCHGYNCTLRTYAWFTPEQWQSIRQIFIPPAQTAYEERQRIGQAIAKMEEYAGHLTKTDQDLAKAPITKRSDFELDCIDETVNSTKYLTFLKDDGLLKFHDVGKPAYRGNLLRGMYPHNSATIVDNKTGAVFVVDSYVYAHAKEPDIRPLESWVQYRIEDLEEQKIKAESERQDHSLAQ